MKFPAHGLLAIDPSCLGVSYAEQSRAAYDSGNGTRVVQIRGPLTRYEDQCFDSYESVLRDISAACADRSVSRIVLDIDSPGGVCAGLFEACARVSAELARAGKALHAHISGTCASAAYALACCASTITCTSTALVGSIGVIDARTDVSAANAAMGVRVAFISSGSAKAYGHCELALTDAEIAEGQRVVDAMARVFFDHVRSSRAIDAQALQARVFVGADALASGLVDNLLTSLEDVIKGRVMTYNELIGALRVMADGEGPDAEAAKAALAKLESAEESTADATPDAECAPDEEPKAEADDPEKDAEPTALAALTARLNELSLRVESSDRAALLASRSDLSEDLKAVLAALPLAQAKKVVASLPKPKSVAKAPTLTPKATVGADHGKATSGEFERIDALMGVGSARATGVVHTAYKTVLGAPKGKV